ncbi:hypothetical protein U1872_18240 [Sphingomonas sp. RB3P16]|uniref:hypothetical protein n=1 Tax=Parasphingomonas frigoris TaxID=3096163 RepID=UPI002FCBAD50
MSAIARLKPSIARALVVEQLNPDQWHTVPQGWALPEGAIGGNGSGVCGYAEAVSYALSVADVTGLPVLVDAYGEPRRALCEVQHVAPYTTRPPFNRRQTLDEILGLSGPSEWEGLR